MDPSASEIEAKFAVSRLEPIRRKLLQLDARQLRPRLPETNLRFDLPDRRLQQTHRVLRLRQDHDSRLTFKAPGSDREHRHELEVAVDQADVMRQILEGLGFEIFFVYEKYRETFTVDGAEVMLDELPFGVFVEVEAGDLPGVRRTAERLGLAWEERLPLSYLALFDRLRQHRAWPFRDATFANFSGIPLLSPDDLRAEAVAR